MAKGRGRGWHGDSARHSIAAKKAAKGRTVRRNVRKKLQAAGRKLESKALDKNPMLMAIRNPKQYRHALESGNPQIRKVRKKFQTWKR